MSQHSVDHFLGKVEVVILNWNGVKFLSECLDGLKNQTYRDFTVTIVDNGSGDGSVQLLEKKYPELKTISLSENLGFSKANNIALREVKSEYVALLNNDAVPDIFWLEKLVKALNRYPEAGFAASKMVFHKNRKMIDRAGDVYTVAGAGLLRGRGKMSSHYGNKEWVFGACAGAAIYRTKMLKEVGLFDEDFFILYEDLDLSFRAQLRGYKCIYIPGAVVFHKASESLGFDSPLAIYYGHRNLEWVYVQNTPISLLPITIFPHIFYVFSSFLFFLTTGSALIFLKAKWHAIKGLKCAFRKRRRIQCGKKVKDKYILSLLGKELLFDRLYMRLKRHGTL